MLPWEFRSGKGMQIGEHARRNLAVDNLNILKLEEHLVKRH